MVKCLSAFLNFCYIAQHNAITDEGLRKLESTLARFHVHREIFIGTAGVTGDQILLPQQHSLKHYVRSIHLFGSPNGLCSSITESKHIKAVKAPWWHSSHFQALAQMLRTNCWLDKLAVACQILTTLGMIGANQGLATGPKSLSSVELAQTSEGGYLQSLRSLAVHINQPQFPVAFHQFLYEQINADSEVSPADADIKDCPDFMGHIVIYHSAIA
ncbi:hypothetical protein BGW80DRAFT_1456775 [Lactifluus volemus]|nr:hypothetical protein BGW80DRAFT_1456775 [Lactifluus volemus]